MSHPLMSLVPMALGFGLSGVSVQAQSLEESLPKNARVRVTLASETDPARTGARLTGQLAGVRPESIMLRTGGSETRELRRDAIVKLERSVQPSRKLKGALVGYGATFAAFLLVAAAMGSSGPCYETGGPECVAAAAIVTLPAAGVGALVAPGERWAEVPPNRLRVSLAPTRGGGVSVRVSLAIARGHTRSPRGR